MVFMSDSLRPHGLYVALQTLLFMEFSRQEHWSGLPFPSPGDFPDPGIESVVAALQVDSLLSELAGKPNFNNPATQIHPLHFQDLHTPPLSVKGPLGIRRRLFP